MPRHAAFGQVVEQVCREQGWRLLPSGVEVPCPDGRHQLVSLEFFESEGAELVRLYTVIGPLETLAPDRLLLALRVNASLAHGAFAVRDADLVMVETLLVDEADAGELEAAVGYLAETADRYEKLVFGTDEN